MKKALAFVLTITMLFAFCTGMAESHIFQSDGICHFGCYTYFFADTVYEVEFYLGKQDC